MNKGTTTAHPNNSPAGVDLTLVFRALRHRNYCLFFFGQNISLIGTWMQQIAMGWLVYRLTNSAFWLGLVGFSGQIPTFLFSPIAGVIADRYHRHRILVLTQTLSMVQALTLAILVLTQHVTIGHVIALSLFLGLVNSFDMPVRQAFTVEMIDKKEDLGNAIALNSSMVNLARLIGPSLGGIFIALWGEGICFLINALSYFAVIFSLLAMRIIPREHPRSARPIFHDLKEGFIYAFNFIPIRAILILLSLVSLMGVPYQILMPIFARDIFHGGPKTLGLLMSMSGIGALAGGVYLAGRRTVIGLSRIIAMAAGLFGLTVIVFAVSGALWLALPALCLVGFAMMVQMASSNTVLQTVVDEDKRGRVMSFYTIAFMGMSPFGSLLAGTLAQKVGAPNTLLAGGAICILGAAIFLKNLTLIRSRIRPVYRQKGIIPEVVQGIEAASGLKDFPSQ